MYTWFEQYSYYGKDKDWKSGQKLTKLNTFEQWFKKLDGKVIDNRQYCTDYRIS